MLALMFDPRFKSLTVVENYVGHGACICLVVEYDANITIFILMIVFEILNLIVQACVIKLLDLLLRLVTLLKKTIIYLVWVHLWKSHHVHLLLGSYPWSRGYLYPLLHVLIL